MSRAIVAVFALIILAIVGVWGVQAALEDAGEDFTVTNETWTPDAGNVTTLNESNRNGAYYADRVTVYDEDRAEMDEGTDYEWFTDNGTVKALSGGGLDGDANATITYSFQQTSSQQRQFADLAGQIPRALGVLFPMFLLVIFLLLVKG